MPLYKENRITMRLTKEEKQSLVEKYGKSKTNSGATETQIALFTHHINHITQHLADHPKDHSSRKGLISLVGKRRRLLDYLHNSNIERYRKILTDLDIRK